MKISLQNFEHSIDETILKRGLKYWKDGCVEDIELVDEGCYEAIVLGSEEYTVRLTINNNVVEEYYCTCPYDYGPVCKHIVAVLFALNEDLLGEMKQSKKKTKTKTTPVKKTKTVKQQVSETLEKLSKEDISAFISKFCERDRNFRQSFLAYFIRSDNSIDESAAYAAMIKADIKSAAGRDGFIDYSHTHHAVRTADELLMNGENNFKNELPERLWAICKAVLKEIPKTISSGIDDSNGSIGSTIENAIELFHKTVTEKNISDKVKKEMFDFCIRHSTGQDLDAGGWEFDVLDIAGILISNDEEQKQLFLILETKAKKGDWHYYEERVARIKAEVIKNRKGNHAAEEFLDSMMHLPEIRKQKIEKLFKEKKYKEVKELAAKSIELDNKFAGLVCDWKEWLLKTAIKENDTLAILYYARKLYFESHNKKENYALLKKHTVKEKWNETVESLLVELNTKEGKWFSDDIATIFVEEKMYDHLLALVKRFPSYDVIESYEKYLITDYKNEVLDIYQTAIIAYLERNTGREHYKKTCRMLRRMKKIGDTKRVTSLIEILKNRYKQRPALIEELRQI